MKGPHCIVHVAAFSHAPFDLFAPDSVELVTGDDRSD